MKTTFKDTDIRIFSYEDSLPIFAMSDLIITQHSSVGLEAIALDIPLVELNLDHSIIPQSWSEQNLAVKIDRGNLPFMASIIDNKNPLVITKKWKDWHLGKRDGKASSRSVDEILSLI